MQIRFAALACAALLASGCAWLVPDAERIDIQQGNLLSSEDIASLEPGLTRRQVRERIGAPILSSPWRSGRWDYIYYRTEAGRQPEARQRLTLYFDERDRVMEIVDRYEAPDAPLADRGTRAVPKVETGGQLPVDTGDERGPSPGPGLPD